MILGITGTDGAGKGMVVRYLIEKHDFVHYSARGIFIGELEKEGRGTTRADLRLKGNEMRKQYGNDFVVSYNLKKIQEDGTKCAVIESIRTMAEATTLREHSGILLAVDADQRLRYERVQARRSESDRVSFEEFQKQEKLEMNDPDPHGMQKAKVINIADHIILNNGSLKELYAQIEEMLTKCKKS